MSMSGWLSRAKQDAGRDATRSGPRHDARATLRTRGPGVSRPWGTYERVMAKEVKDL